MNMKMGKIHKRKVKNLKLKSKFEVKINHIVAQDFKKAKNINKTIKICQANNLWI